MIKSNWIAPTNIHLVSTTRDHLKGSSQPPYNSLNLGDHVGDLQAHVDQNRILLCDALQLPSSPIYLNQTHSTNVLNTSLLNTEILNREQLIQNKPYDAIYSAEKNRVTAIMTADCLPVAFCNLEGTEVAIAHAGWRGLCDGILENTVAHFLSSPDHLVAWLGPAISQKFFEVGAEVRQQFIDKQPHLLTEITQAFRPHPNNPGKYFADLYQLARIRLQCLGIKKIYGGEYCTYQESDRFFSYRRDGVTGRQATLIWIAD